MYDRLSKRGILKEVDASSKLFFASAQTGFIFNT
jgi:hypothetical protein